MTASKPKAPLAILVGIFASFSAQAVTLGPCADLPDTKMHIALAAVSGDFVGSEPFEIKEGKVVVIDDKAMLSRAPSDNKDVYKYKVGLGDGIFETRTLEITRDTKGNVAIRRMNDVDAQVAFAKKQGRYTDAMDRLPKASGFESQFTTSGDKCRLEQAAVIEKLKMGSKTATYREVTWDSAYCDRIEKLLSEKGKEKVQECTNILESANKIFSSRQSELMKENKFLQTLVLGEGFMAAASKISLCAPAEWNMRLRTMLTGGMASASPPKPEKSAAPVTKPANGPATSSTVEK